MTYDRCGFHRIVDLGRWWKTHYDLPLPLGCNALLRSLEATVERWNGHVAAGDDPDFRRGTTYYESLVTSTEVIREAVVDAHGLVHAPEGIGLGLPAGPDYPPELCHLVIDAARSASIL